MTARSSERMLCSHHGDFAHMNRLPACPLCMDDLVTRLETAESQVAALTKERDDALSVTHSGLVTRITQRAEAAEAALAEARTQRARMYLRLRDERERLADTRRALEQIAEQQPRTIDWLRANGIVFDGPLGTDPDNWEHVAFSIYTDLCEMDAEARRALAATGGETWHMHIGTTAADGLVGGTGQGTE